MRPLLLLLCIGSALLVGCTSETENRLLNACVDQFYNRGWFDKNTGKLVTRESDIIIFGQVNGVCRTKVEMHLDGYRVQPVVEDGDMQIYLFKEGSGLKSFYKKKLLMRN